MAKQKSFLGKTAAFFGRALSFEPLYNTGGSNGGSQRYYNPRNGGPNANLVGGFARMRAYSRDITRKIPELDDGYDTRVANIIGKGIRGIPMCKDENIRKQIKLAWETWSLHADFDDWDINSMDRLLIREADEAGEVFLRRVYLSPKCGLNVPIQFQILESEQLDHTYNVAPVDDKNYIVAGIEYSPKGKVVAYHFWAKNPTDSISRNLAIKRIRVPAEDVCHWFNRTRSGQFRGSPRAHTGQMQMRDLMMYEENELERKKNSSASYATITSTESSLMSELGTSPDPLGDETAESGGPAGTDPSLVEKGSIIHLYPGEKLEETKVAESDPNYDTYVASKNRTNAKSLGLSYESYTGDMRNSSYSGLRIAKNTEEIKFSMVQDAFIKKVKQFVWESWFDQAVLCGAIRVSNYATRRAEYQEINWQAPGWKYINPLQEINATAAEINAGITTRTMAAAARGHDFEEIQAQKAKEKELEMKYRTGSGQP